MKESIIYLDYAAASPLDQKALRAMMPYLSERFYNPSSPYAPALAVRRDFEAAKESIAHAIGGRGTELIMTAGATESIQLAFSSSHGHVITTEVEHQSVIAAASQHAHTFVPTNETGRVSASSIAAALRPDTELVSVQLANNEIGTIQPLRAIAAVIEKERQARRETQNNRPLYFHTDASQGLGLLDVNVARFGVDMMTVNAGKVYGPKQVGALWASPRVTLAPVIVGGGQEQGLRSGTENVAGAIGFAEALRRANIRRKSENERLRAVRDTLRDNLVAQFPDLVVSGHQKHQLPNFLHLSFSRIDAERILFALESRGVLVATGSACAANKGTRSHVLTAIGLSDDLADGSIRISLGRGSTVEQCREVADIIHDVVSSEYARIGDRS